MAVSGEELAGKEEGGKLIPLVLVLVLVLWKNLPLLGCGANVLALNSEPRRRKDFNWRALKRRIANDR